MTIDVAHIPAHSILHHHITSIPYSREKASDICAVTSNILKKCRLRKRHLELRGDNDGRT
jgi:hypothetical protein